MAHIIPSIQPRPKISCFVEVVEALELPKKHKGRSPCIGNEGVQKVPRFYIQVSPRELRSLIVPVLMTNGVGVAKMVSII
jgi:hypothetical protein